VEKKLSLPLEYGTDDYIPETKIISTHQSDGSTLNGNTADAIVVSDAVLFEKGDQGRGVTQSHAYTGRYCGAY
jgi:hypothetical protein